MSYQLREINSPTLEAMQRDCYETSSRKDRKDRSTPYNLASSRGKTSFTLHK